MTEPSSNASVDNWPVVASDTYDKRRQARYPSVTKVWVITYDTGDIKPKFIKFKSVNISHEGMMVKTGSHPFEYNQKVDVAMILTLNEKVTKIYRLTGHVRHQLPAGFTGFAFSKRI